MGHLFEGRELTEAQLVDAVAVGQVTPGPVFTTATFIGYVLGGLSGAAVSTVAIFLPSFLLVALSGPLWSAIRAHAWLRRALDGVNVASLALMAVVTAQLALPIVRDGYGAALALLAFVLLVRWRVGSAWLILGGAGAGLLVNAVR